jgi:hypothetical protein
MMPAGSLLPAAAAWMSPAVRGLLAMAPPPLPPTYISQVPCPGVPQTLNSSGGDPNTGNGRLLCGECLYDAQKLCAFTNDTLPDTDPSGYPQWTADPGSWFLHPYDLSYRGFDDPQADPDLTMPLQRSITITFKRADLFDLGGGLGVYTADDVATGNPPWGSKLDPVTGLVVDGDADGLPDALPDRHNRGAYAAIFDNDPIIRRTQTTDPANAQQSPNDALALSSCGPVRSDCNVYTTDCGGMGKYNDKAPIDPNTGLKYDPYPVSPPVGGTTIADWPVIPITRREAGFNTTDEPSVPIIKRLLRFSSSIVNYNSAAMPLSGTVGSPSGGEYSLAETANDVVVTAPGTPIAGLLKDAYTYFKNTVFQDTDPSADCRNHIIVYLTDGIDECGSDACSGGISPTGGPAGDLGDIVLPASAPCPPTCPSSREQVHAINPTVRVKGIPVFVVALMDPDDPRYGALTCIATHSGGKVYSATNRAQLILDLQSILDFKATAHFFAAPSVPAFARGGGFSTAQVGAVIPSHLNVNGTVSQWAIWNGSLKSFQLDKDGNIPVVAAVPAPPPPGPPATPTPTPSASTSGFPDESDPDAALVVNRKPVWNAARVLGYTDPVASLGGNQAPAPAAPSTNAPEIDVWPGRKLLWAEGAGGTKVPLDRKELMPNTPPCNGACFTDLAAAMGATTTKTTDVVNFLRGGITSFGSRDQVLNLPAQLPYNLAGLVGPGALQQQRFSYFYQDDIPAPGTNPPQLHEPTDGATPIKGYSHKLGDLFHSEPLSVDPPRYFQYLSARLTPRSGACGGRADCEYGTFAGLHGKRRRVIYVGSNDGFVHAFDVGVWNRDLVNFPGSFDLGTGREIFGYTLEGLMGNFPNLISYPPVAQYFMDGSFGSADVFIDTNFTGLPVDLNRDWKTVLVGSLRQGGKYVYGLDVTYPDLIDTNPASLTYGEITTVPKDNSPYCLDGAVGCPSAYPQILWELTDDCTVQPTRCALPNTAKMGETWSRPVVGRIKVLNGGSTLDKYVAIFGGGYDKDFKLSPPDTVVDATVGREFYIVDVETGQILYKAVDGKDGGGATFKFAPMPAAPTVVDYNDDGYLDIAYIGDVLGQMWRIDLTPDATVTPKRGDLVAGLLTGYQPFLLFRTDPANSIQPIFLEAAAIYLSGGPRPTLGVAFGTGDRANLELPSPNSSRFYFVVDANQTTTATQENLRNITPGAPAPGGVPGPSNSGCNTSPCTGYYLDFLTRDEKTTSTVFSTLGYLTLVTFTPPGGAGSSNACATEGNSIGYRFFFLNGQAQVGYHTNGTPNTYGDYRTELGPNYASVAQSISPSGDIIDRVLYSTGLMDQIHKKSSLGKVNQNWKEQQ